MEDNRRIKTRDAGKLTLTNIRHLVTWCNNQNEGWWDPAPGQELSVAQILSCYHAANDANYAGMVEWASEDRTAAVSAWNRIRASRPQRRKRAA